MLYAFFIFSSLLLDVDSRSCSLCYPFLYEEDKNFVRSKMNDTFSRSCFLASRFHETRVIYPEFGLRFERGNACF